MAAISSTKAKPAEKKKPFKKTKLKEVTGYDLFYQLIYMSAVAAAGIERRKIFQMASELPRKTAAYFRRIHLLSQRLGYDYSESCKIVGEKVKSEVMKSLLLRMADSLRAGQPEAKFLAEEAGIQTLAYEKEYERDLESLKKWTDGYASLIIASALIIIVNLISVLIYPIDSSMVGVLVVVGVLTAAGGAWVLSRAAPAEKRALFAEGGGGPKLQRMARTLTTFGGAAAVVIAIPLGMFVLDLGYALIIAGGLLLPAGITSMWAGREAARKDMEIGSFLRSLGTYATSTGTTIGESLDRLDLSSFPTINADLKRLRARMRASIDPTLCWKKFSEETGSRLIAETTVIFNDAIGLGGAADTVGLFAAEYAAMTNTLRSKRLVVSSTFTSLTIVMHGVLAVMMIVILEVIRNFSKIIDESMAAASEALDQTTMPLPSFGSPDIGFLEPVAIGMVIALAFINAYAVAVTDGEHLIKATLYLAALLILSGVALVFVPPAVANMVAV
jgi:archaellum biogenesis protein FlaJ (TadC family)